MKHIALFAAVMVFRLSEAMPINDCRDHYEYCGQWAKGNYCELKDYKDYMELMCPYSCGLCDELQSELSSSGEPTTVSTVSEGGIHRVMPEVDENFEDLGSTSQQSNVQADQKDKSQGRSGSGDKQNEPIFRATATEETESRFHGEAEQQDQSGDQQESVSGSGLDLTGANFWAVVRVEPNTVDRGSDRQLHISRRSEKSTADIAKDEDEGSASGTQTSGENVSQKSDIPDKSSSGSGVTSGSGEHVSQRSEVLITSSLDQDVVSGEDDAPFDNSSAETESDSGCSSGDGCYESDSVQGETGDGNARSVIAKAEQDAIASGSAASSGDSSSNVWLHPHFDVLAGPYDEKTSASGATPTSSGSGSVIELGSGLHDIEDAIFETGIPLQITHDAAPGSGLPSPPNAERHDDSQTSGSGIGGVEKKEDARLFKVPLHHEKMSLMEKMMKLGKLQAFQISHIATGRGRGRDQVPRLSDNDEDDNMTVHSDLGRGKKVTFVLNQDFYDGYANENSAAYNILANNVKKEVERALGSNTTVSEISFSEVREPAHAPRFSKVLTSFKLLGDDTKLEKMVQKGFINSLVVDKKFFHTS